MTKNDLIIQINKDTGIDKSTALTIIESFMENVKNALSKGNNVYLRGFGSFIIKERAQKTARNISQNTTIVIPAHNIPVFKPSKEFMKNVSQEG